MTGAAAATVGAAALGVPELAGTTGKKISNDEIAQLLTRSCRARCPTRSSRHNEAHPTAEAVVELVDPALRGEHLKTFVLGEELRQADSPDVVQTITERQLALDESVWSPDSATFNPPHLSGMVTEQTAIEAMILHSDNTGADMCLKQAGTDETSEHSSRRRA